jgi:flagella basal body P-ring formation protein FlgA
MLLVSISLFEMVPAACADLEKLLEPVQAGGRKPGFFGAPQLVADSAAPKKAAAPSGAPLLLTEGELIAGIEKDLPKRYPVKGELRVSLAKPWTSLQLQAPDFFAECIQLPASGIATNMPVTVRGVSGGKIIGEWPLQLKVQVWQNAWVASQRMDRGQVLSTSVLSVQKVDVLREQNAVIPEDQDISGLELSQSLQQGRPVTRKDLVERTVVRKGQFVDAVGAEGTFSVRLRAVAMESGPAGAVIKVRNVDSQKEFFAQVINEKQVQVRF